MSHVFAGKPNLLQDYSYTFVCMHEKLKETISTRSIKSDQYPSGVLHSAQRLFELSIQYFSLRKRDALFTSSRNYYQNPFAPYAAFLLLSDVMKRSENIELQTTKDYDNLESKIKEIHNFNKTLGQPKKLNKKELQIAIKTSKLFKDLYNLYMSGHNERYSFGY